jgi:dinuclear metal center YbgI/SA1388 family protein
MSEIISDNVLGNKIHKLIKNELSVYAAHSSLDRAQEGLNRYFGHKIGLTCLEPYSGDDRGYVVIGYLESPMTLKALAEKIGEVLNISEVRYVGEDHKLITKVAFVTGSGMSLLKEAVFDEADVFLTGDLKYHDAMWVYESGNSMIDVTHFGSEKIVTDLLYDLIKKVVDKDVLITKDQSITNPIKSVRC